MGDKGRSQIRGGLRVSGFFFRCPFFDVYFSRQETSNSSPGERGKTMAPAITGHDTECPPRRTLRSVAVAGSLIRNTPARTACRPACTSRLRHRAHTSPPPRTRSPRNSPSDQAAGRAGRKRMPSSSLWTSISAMPAVAPKFPAKRKVGAAKKRFG